MCKTAMIKGMQVWLNQDLADLVAAWMLEQAMQLLLLRERLLHPSS